MRMLPSMVGAHTLHVSISLVQHPPRPGTISQGKHIRWNPGAAQGSGHPGHDLHSSLHALRLCFLTCNEAQ